MANPFISFTFAAAGTSNLRSMPDRLAEVKNVLDWGASPTGTNCVTSVQAAVDSVTSGNHGTIYFPPGVYTIGSPGVKFNHVGDTTIRFCGEGRASSITSNFAGFTFERSSATPPSTLDVGPIIFDHLSIVNNSSSGGCIRVGSVRGVHVRNCVLAGFQGVWFCGQTYDACEACLMENCLMTGTAGVVSTLCNGVVIGGSGSIVACDISGNTGTGIRVFGKGASVRDTRMERNNVAILVGKKPDTTDDTTCGNFMWTGGGTESNALTLDMENCTAFLVAATSVSGGTSAQYRGGAIGGVLTLTDVVTGVSVTTNSAGIDVFGNFFAASMSGGTIIVGEEGLSITGHTSIVGLTFGTTLVTGTPVGQQVQVPGVSWVRQVPTYNTFIGPNVKNGVFAGYSAGNMTSDTSCYISDTTNRAGIVFIGCGSNAPSGFGVPSTIIPWRVPTTAHTAEFLNCTAGGYSGPVASPLAVYLYANLPSGANVRDGDEYNISDCTVNTWGTTAAGGGSNHVRVRYNSATAVWTVMGR